MPSTGLVSSITNCYRLRVSYNDPVHSFIISWRTVEPTGSSTLIILTIYISKCFLKHFIPNALPCPISGSELNRWAKSRHDQGFSEQTLNFPNVLPAIMGILWRCPSLSEEPWRLSEAGWSRETYCNTPLQITINRSHNVVQHCTMLL